jgi:hypothetical protein
LGFSKFTTHLRQYVHADLENDEEFYKGAISTLGVKFSGISEFWRKKEDLPSTIHLKMLAQDNQKFKRNVS